VCCCPWTSGSAWSSTCAWYAALALRNKGVSVGVSPPFYTQAVTFWHCERSAAALAAGKKWPGSNFCKVGYRQQWPGENSSLNIKGIEQAHFWTVRSTPPPHPRMTPCTHTLLTASSLFTTTQEVPVVNGYLTSLLVFTLSFFNQQAFGKYSAALSSAGQANGALTNVAFHCFSQMSYDLPKARNLMRMLHAYHHMSYMNFGGKLTNPRSWEMLRDRNLLSAEECEYLNGKSSPLRPGSSKLIHVLGWAYQLLQREVKEGRVSPPVGNLFIAEMMTLRSACGAMTGSQENPMPFGYMFAVNFLLYCWALSVGLYFAGFLSVYGSVAYALVVYIFFNLRNIGIQLSEPFGYKERHLPVPAFLMRSYTDHRDLLADNLSYMKPEGTAITDGSVPNFIAPLRAKYDVEWAANFKANSGAVKQMAIMQGRFGFPGITEEDRAKPSKGDQEKPASASAPAPPPPAAAPPPTAKPSSNETSGPASQVSGPTKV